MNSDLNSVLIFNILPGLPIKSHKPSGPSFTLQQFITNLSSSPNTTFPKPIPFLLSILPISISIDTLFSRFSFSVQQPLCNNTWQYTQKILEIKHAVTGVHNDIQSHPVTTASSTKSTAFTSCLSYDWILGRSLWTAWCKISCWSPPKFHPLLVKILFPFPVLAKLSITALLKLPKTLSNARHEEIF